MSILFFDVETTGKANLRVPVSAPYHPRVVSFAVMMTTDEGDELEWASEILKCDEFDIPEGASNIHGITDAIAAKKGVSRKGAFGVLADMAKEAELAVAHNIQFDSFMVLVEADRLQIRDPLKSLPTYCTMLNSIDLCKIHSHYHDGNYTWPKLEEAYQTLCGKKLVGAHDALNDVRACKEVYFAIQSLAARGKK